MSRMSLEFEGFNEAVKRLERLEGNVRKVTNEALIKSKRLAHQQAGAAMSSHNESYATIRSLDNTSLPEWAGTTATIHVGFNIRKGGLASIFLMYGTPRMKKDTKLYNAFYGNKIKKEVHKLQEEIFMKEIRKLGG